MIDSTIIKLTQTLANVVKLNNSQHGLALNIPLESELFLGRILNSEVRTNCRTVSYRVQSTLVLSDFFLHTQSFHIRVFHYEIASEIKPEISSSRTIDSESFA